MPIQAFQLGENCDLAQQLISTGHLIPLPDGFWRVKTRESLEEGELAATGDYVKIDRSGMPYPNGKNWFEANHTRLEENLYHQNAEPKTAWESTLPMIPEIQFLLDRNLLIWNPRESKGAFSAFLWGALQTADADAVIILDRVEADNEGNLQIVEFHFVARDEFRSTYDII